MAPVVTTPSVSLARESTDQSEWFTQKGQLYRVDRLAVGCDLLIPTELFMNIALILIMVICIMPDI